VTNSQDLKPGRSWYAVAISIPIVGIIIFATFIWMNLSHMTQGLTQVLVPGVKELLLDHPGKYTIFHETQTSIGNQLYQSGQDISGLKCTLVSKKSGEAVPLMPPSMSQKYSLPGREGIAALEFSIDQPGAYEFSADYPPGFSGGQVVLAIGQGFMKRLFLTVFGGLAILFSSLSLGLALALITFLKRRKRQRESST
jgi:hypothetical protein